MSRKIRLFSVVCISLLVVSIGFNIVLALPEGVPEPGSDQDPLISKSYVDQTLGQLNQTLQTLQEQQFQQQTQLDQMKKANEDLAQKLAAQDAVIKTLQDALKGAKTQTPPAENKPAAPNTPAAVKGIVTASALRIRSQANTTSSVVASVLKGESVTIIEKGAEWHKIKTSKGVTGYALGKYISIK
jgi:hypothetical protein